MDVPRSPRKNRRSTWIVAGVLGAVLIVVLLVAAGRPGGPEVEMSSVYVESVERGEMVRDVAGPGSLVPEEARYVSAITSGRVERVAVRPGASVADTSVLLVLTNPDVQIQALNADRELADARARLVTLRADVETAILGQASEVAELRQQAADASRRAAAEEKLVEEGYVVPLDHQQQVERAATLEARLDLEERRLALMRGTRDDQIAAQEAQVERLRAIARFQERLVQSMVTRAGTRGIVQEVPVEVGQYVLAGSPLARIIPTPVRLKAVLRIPETQAAELTVGQPATIDTRNGVIEGRVVRIDPASSGGAVNVDVALDGELPTGARPALQISGVIELDRLPDALHVGRPARAQPHADASLFRLDDDGRIATRVQARLGRLSARRAEVLSGLEPGDRVIVSDMSRWEDVERIRLR